MAGSTNPFSQHREPRQKRRRDESESPRRGAPRRANSNERSQPPESRSEGSEARSQPANGDAPRKRRRPGPSGGVSKAQREAHLQQTAQREAERKRREDEWAAQQSRIGIHEAVKEHYNLVPQRGREWRRTESKIKGLREFNNWIKSVMIQRFSPSQNDVHGGRDGRGAKPLLVLDIGCGKGGDLFKWQKAPQKVGLYVGIDPAEVSIQQATDRYRDTRRKSRQGIFDAHFFAMDGYGKWLGEVPIIQEVGIDPNVGGRGSSSRWGAGGFDVVTMMFCMHYAFESEEKARGMLKNAAGALSKGGRFIGVIPSSDVIRSGLEKYYKVWDQKMTAKMKADAEKADAEKADAEKADAEKADAEKTGKEGANGEASEEKSGDNKGDTKALDSPGFVPDSPAFVPDSPPFAPDSPGEAPDAEMAAEATTNAVLENVAIGDVSDVPEPSWGNSLYRVRFPPDTPKNGVFRPMYGWRYQFKLEEAVEEVPEYIVPFEGFRALAEDYNLEMTYCKPFMEIFEENRDDVDLGPLSVRMGVTDRVGGQLKMTAEEREAASFYLGFCFVKI